ncbi:MAG TPA: hypothetical protein VLB69_03490 [Rudaea sp.]|nr:hypothetical protein [Rudaea sp.]
MTSDKHLVVIGLSEEDEAHLRLLMRRAALDHLAHRWHWGAEDQADLVIVDPATFAGQMARGRARGSGRRCAVYSATEPLQEGELRLPRPMKLEPVAELFNEVATATEIEASASFVPAREGFHEFGDLAPQTDEIEEVELHLESGEQREARPAEGLDDLIKTDTAATKPLFSVQLELKEDATMEAGRRVTARREKRVADSAGGLRRPDRASEINLSTPPALEPAPLHAPNTLRDYLRGNILGGPATITLPGSPPLTLDPKARVYHSTAAALGALMPYCRQPLPARDWHALTTTELARVRDEQPAQPYSRLIWLATLVRSGGRLAAHLDPGGRYKLKDGVPIESDQPSHARIGSVMRDMAKVNEIAAVSGAPMSEVFDVINAYEAIHALETERRESRYTEPVENAGLFAKLRKSLLGR